MDGFPDLCMPFTVVSRGFRGESTGITGTRGFRDWCCGPRVLRESGCESREIRARFVRTASNLWRRAAASTRGFCLCSACPVWGGGVGSRWRGCGLMEDFDNDDDDTTTTRPGPQLTAERPDDPDPNTRWSSRLGGPKTHQNPITISACISIFF